jgi:hypothetical protein
MKTTLKIDDRLYREAKAEAARAGITVTLFIEEALRQKIAGARGAVPPELQSQIDERDRLMEKLLHGTARFRVGRHPTREEMNAR